VRLQNNNNDQSQLEKKNRSITWIVLVFLIVIYSVVYFIVINIESIPDIQLWLKILIYLFVMILLIGPFVPMKNKGGKRVSLVDSLIRMIQGSNNHRFTHKPDSNLNVEFRPPLILKCKCGFLITRRVEKCPNCKRNNDYYSKD